MTDGQPVGQVSRSAPAIAPAHARWRILIPHPARPRDAWSDSGLGPASARSFFSGKVSHGQRPCSIPALCTMRRPNAVDPGGVALGRGDRGCLSVPQRACARSGDHTPVPAMRVSRHGGPERDGRAATVPMLPLRARIPGAPLMARACAVATTRNSRMVTTRADAPRSARACRRTSASAQLPVRSEPARNADTLGACTFRCAMHRSIDSSA